MNRPRLPARGFTLIEAMVALAITASLGGALFLWINQSLNASARIERYYQTLEHRQNVAQWLRTLNPGVAPTGTARFGDLQIQWTSKALTEQLDQMGYPGGMGLYKVALYEVTVTARGVLAASEEETSKSTHKLAGYKKVRELGSVLNL